MCVCAFACVWCAWVIRLIRVIRMIKILRIIWVIRVVTEVSLATQLRARLADRVKAGAFAHASELMEKHAAPCIRKIFTHWNFACVHEVLICA